MKWSAIGRSTIPSIVLFTVIANESGLATIGARNEAAPQALAF